MKSNSSPQVPSNGVSTWNQLDSSLFCPSSPLFVMLLAKARRVTVELHPPDRKKWHCSPQQKKQPAETQESTHSRSPCYVPVICWVSLKSKTSGWPGNTFPSCSHLCICMFLYDHFRAWCFSSPGFFLAFPFSFLLDSESRHQSSCLCRADVPQNDVWKGVTTAEVSHSAPWTGPARDRAGAWRPIDFLHSPVVLLQGSSGSGANAPVAMVLLPRAREKH